MTLSAVQRRYRQYHNLSKKTDVNRSETLELVGEETTEEQTDTSRRTVLKGAVASAVATLGFSNNAAAIDPTGEVEREQVAEKYRSDAAVGAVVREHGGELLELLAERGVVETANAGELGEFRVSPLRRDGTATARVHTERELDDGELVVNLEPETGRSYAVETTSDGTTIHDPAVDSNEVDPSACIVGSECMTDSGCDSGCLTQKVCCCIDYFTSVAVSTAVAGRATRTVDTSATVRSTSAFFAARRFDGTSSPTSRRRDTHAPP